MLTLKVVSVTFGVLGVWLVLALALGIVLGKAIAASGWSEDERDLRGEILTARSFDRAQGGQIMPSEFAVDVSAIMM